MMVSGWLICKACQFSPPLASSYFLSIPGLCVCHSYLTFWRVPDPPLHPVRPFGDPVPVLPAAQVQVLSVIETVGGWGSRDYPMATGDTSFSVIQRLLLRLPGPNPLTSLDIPISSQTISLVCLKPISTSFPRPAPLSVSARHLQPAGHLGLELREPRNPLSHLPCPQPTHHSVLAIPL